MTALTLRPLLFPLLAAGLLGAAAPAADNSKSLGDTTKTQEKEIRPRRTDPAMEAWRDHRFGVFIHWGIFSVPGGTIDGQAIPGAAEWSWTAYANKGRKKEYESFVNDFNPTQYDPAEWARLIKQSGARYVVFVTKHHDGFCLFDSALTDYDAASTPYGKDLLRPFVEACRAEGLGIGLYYSIIDWHHPNYTARELKNDADHASYRIYLDYMKGQLKELLTNYGEIDILWFDGRWDASYKLNPQYGIEVERYCRELDADIIINDRVRAYDSYADYDASYERRLPEPDKVIDLDWECCMTLPERTWGYHRQPDGEGWKSPRKIIGQLAECASRGGNFLLNLGPTPEGTIRPEEQERLKAVGAWMEKHGDAIRGTRPAGLDLSPAKRETGHGIFVTRSGEKKRHLIITRWPDTDRIFLTGLEGEVARATLRTPDGAVELGHAVETNSKGDHAYLHGLPLCMPGGLPAAVIDLELE